MREDQQQKLYGGSMLRMGAQKEARAALATLASLSARDEAG